MRFIRQLLNNIKEAFRGIARNKGMASLSIISIAGVLLLFGIVTLLLVNINGIVSSTGQQVNRVVVYLLDNATDENIQEIIQKAEETGLIEDVEYTSKEQALASFNAQIDNVDMDTLMEGLENPLPASLTFMITDIREAENIADSLRLLPGVDQVSYLPDLISRILQVSNWVQIIGIIVMGILLIIAIVLIHNTIRATMTNRSREIQIMKYIGATNGYIRRPLLLEGVVFGIIASLLSLLIVYFGYDYLIGSVSERISILFNVNLVPAQAMIQDLTIIFLCMGVGIGLIGSAISIKRYLNV